MKCIYYSCYPYASSGWHRSIKETKHGDAFRMPFMLYRAAVCFSESINESVEGFLRNIYEALDCPDCKGVDDYRRPYVLDDVKVFPTSHLYGATNSCDGVYEIDGRYYTVGDHGIAEHACWSKAVDKVRERHSRHFYLGGINYAK